MLNYWKEIEFKIIIQDHSIQKKNLNYVVISGNYVLLY